MQKVVEYSVPGLSIVFMVITALFGIVIPIALFLVFRKKYKADIAPFFIGCGVFFLFAIVLEGILNSVILASGAGKTIQGNIWLFGIYGGFMAGLFEETGRFAAFKTVFKKYRSNDMNALMYGAGHGGFEAFFILFFAMLSNIVISLMLNAGMTNLLTAGVTDEATLQSITNMYKTLSETPSITFLVGTVERIAAVAIHISLSIPVWFAAKKGGMYFLLYPLSILLHWAVDTIAVVASKYIASVWLVEVIIYIITACLVLIAYRVWKKHASSQDEFGGACAGDVEAMGAGAGEVEAGATAVGIEAGDAENSETENEDAETGEAETEEMATKEAEAGKEI